MGSAASIPKSGAERSEFASYRDDFHQVRRCMYVTSHIVI